MSYLNVVRSQLLLNGFRAISWYFSDLKTAQLNLANAGIPLELLYESQLTHFVSSRIESQLARPASHNSF